MRSWEAQISAVAALDEPTRRQLYDYVVHQPEPVSRNDADRLVEEKLLDVVDQRRTGRTGLGAGRPAKLYRRSEQHVAVSLPPRQYDLAGRLLSSAVEQAERSGQPPRALLDQRAYQLGKQLGEAEHAAAGNDNAHDTALRVLEAHGFQPRLDGGRVTLANCPFHALAQDYTDIVCGMNLSLLNGLLDGVGTTGLTACLDRTPPFCCVRLEPVAAAPSPDIEP